MQSVSSKIWTRVAVSISYDDNDYTTGSLRVIVWEEEICLALKISGFMMFRL